MPSSTTRSSKSVPLPGVVPELEVSAVPGEGDPPSPESLKAARSLLLAEYGPCAAAHEEILVATARRIEAGTDSRT